MTINLRDKTTARLLGSAFALAMAVSPLVLTFDQGGCIFAVRPPLPRTVVPAVAAPVEAAPAAAAPAVR